MFFRNLWVFPIRTVVCCSGNEGMFIHFASLSTHLVFQSSISNFKFFYGFLKGWNLFLQNVKFGISLVLNHGLLQIEIYRSNLYFFKLPLFVCYSVFKRQSQYCVACLIRQLYAFIRNNVGNHWHWYFVKYIVKVVGGGEILTYVPARRCCQNINRFLKIICAYWSRKSAKRSI